MTFYSNHPKWSYFKEKDGYVAEVQEKKVISNIATVGIYYFKYGRDFVFYAEKMIALNQRVNGEFYVAPVFNLMIANEKKIKTYNVKEMWGIGTPEDWRVFRERDIS
jgi:dTDP-glucose pyrophosphorylase